jgi:Mn2+/Fe2+ NRAMP family transporter
VDSFSDDTVHDRNPACQRSNRPSDGKRYHRQRKRLRSALAGAATSVLLQVFVRCRRYAPALKFLTLVLFFYVATAFTVQIPWGKAFARAVWPAAEVNRDYLLMVVAVLGTTISPYLFFWQASQEVEEMKQNQPRRPLREQRPLKELLRGGESEIERIALDTSVGMAFSNIIAFFIILTTAAVLNAGGVTNIRSAAEADEALRPLAGDLTFVLFALGIVGTGLLAVPVLAGSAAYCVSEAFGWPATLEAKAPDAVGFYSIIAAATVVGLALGYAPIDPIQMLIWSAVLNGIVAVPIMAVMMVVVTRLSVMGRFSARPTLTFFGWAGTALMAVTVVALFWSSIG